MPFERTQHVPKARLVQELEALGMDPRGARADLVSRLQQCGVYQINTSLPPPVKFCDTTCRFPNHSSILLGQGAQIECQKDERLVICNSQKNPPLIEGSFTEGIVTINNCIHLENSPHLSSDTPGTEGELRRIDDTLYVFRSTNTIPGWYSLQFGPMLLV